MILHILKPEAEDYTKLTDICHNAKKHWGYPDYLIDLWKDDLTITPRFIRNNYVLKVENERQEILGFGSILKDSVNSVYEITHLWVLPACISNSVGKFLLENLEKKASHQNTVKVVSDPNMVPFFQKYGYQKVGEVKSKPDGRKLPLMKKIIKRTN